MFYCISFDRDTKIYQKSFHKASKGVSKRAYSFKADATQYLPIFIFLTLFPYIFLFASFPF